MNTLPRIKADLIAGMDERRRTAREFVETIDPTLRVHEDSDWTAKDLITHLSAFEEDMVQAIQAFMDGETYRLDLRGATSVDEFNDIRRAEQQSISWEQALEDWQSARDQLRGVLVAFPDSELNTPFSTPFMQKHTLMQAVKGCGIHEKIHINEIKTALED